MSTGSPPPGGGVEQPDAAGPDPDGTPLGGIRELGRANALLSSLHDVVRSMSSPLSVDELIPAIRPQLQELFHPEVLVLLAGDPTTGRMTTVHADGCRLPASLEPAELPPVLAPGPRGRPQLRDDLGSGDGFGEDSRSGAYVWLFSRGRTAGLLAMEHSEQLPLSEAASDTLERLGLPLALALDNAVWFRRLRTIGAEEERQRLGATLHDRFAQSLAYVAMSLDRAGKRHPEDTELQQLRTDVRSTLGELRETLSELRLAVGEEHPLEEAIEEHLERLEQRHGVIAELQRAPDAVHAPTGVAQQLLRICQDLTTLAAVEQRATRLVVALEQGPGRLVLEVRDDGGGTSEQELGMDARDRLSGVRDRVEAIGARFRLTPEPGHGTVVRVELRGTM